MNLAQVFTPEILNEIANNTYIMLTKIAVILIVTLLPFLIPSIVKKIILNIIKPFFTKKEFKLLNKTIETAESISDIYNAGKQ